MTISDEILNQLYEKAKESYDNGEIPVAAAILNSDNEVVCIAGNNRQKNCNVLGHAEINCVLEAERIIGDWRLDGYYMIVTLEPCDMCSMVIKECRLDKVYYLLEKNVQSEININIKKEGLQEYEKYKEKFNKLLTTFFDNMR